MRITRRKCFVVGLVCFFSTLIYLRSSSISTANNYQPELAKRKFGQLKKIDNSLCEQNETYERDGASPRNSTPGKDPVDNNHNSLDCGTGVRFSRHPLSQTALASFPGTGNTWMRHLIERMTGLATGSVHHDRSLLGVFCGEDRADHSVVAIKTHLRYPNNTFTPDKVLLLIRNPYHAIVANFNRIYSGRHTGTAPTEAWQKYWKSESRRFQRAWLPFYRSWLQAKNVMPVVYENIQHHLEKELAHILSFLGVDGDIRRAIKDPEGCFHRRHSGSSLKMYTTSQRRRINRMIDDTQTMFSENSMYEDSGYNMTKWKL
ncbi:WSCD family member GA21586-like [Haliotis asinina]|uniref:WSCD family member GA21586-like n=1 Tax=Haliotis asinina TaxID=109174 RepID=UPI0035322EC7